MRRASASHRLRRTTADALDANPLREITIQSPELDGRNEERSERAKQQRRKHPYHRRPLPGKAHCFADQKSQPGRKHREKHHGRDCEVLVIQLHRQIERCGRKPIGEVRRDEVTPQTPYVLLSSKVLEEGRMLHARLSRFSRLRRSRSQGFMQAPCRRFQRCSQCARWR